ncbi:MULTISPECIES: hypothetical protein [Bacillus]|nr:MULTISPECIES: hypothetical protein [Bacillus cereus group]MDF2082791.1 hypothetical protein [Bacillus pseudomycoides]
MHNSHIHTIFLNTNFFNHHYEVIITNFVILVGNEKKIHPNQNNYIR